jgi:hypothetical protein
MAGKVVFLFFFDREISINLNYYTTDLGGTGDFYCLRHIYFVSPTTIFPGESTEN